MMVRVPSKEEFHGLFDPQAELFRDVSLVWPPAARGYLETLSKLPDLGKSRIWLKS